MLPLHPGGPDASLSWDASHRAPAVIRKPRPSSSSLADLNLMVAPWSSFLYFYFPRACVEAV